MRLNNKGWGTMQMILMTLFLLIMLAISWYYINSLFNGQLVKNKTSMKESFYDSVKISLREAAEKFYHDNNYTGDAILTYKLLRERGYITDAHDFLDFSCTGYVTVSGGVFKPYIKCYDYTSEGYISDFE